MTHRPSIRQSAVAVLCVLALAAAGHAQYESVQASGYTVTQFSSTDGASIDLYDSRGNLVAILVFLSVSPAELPSAYKGEDDVIRLYFTSDRLGDSVDLLRNESGVTVRLWLGPENNSHITTTKVERVGGGAP